MEKNNINESNVDRRLTSSHETKRSRPMFDTSRLVKDLNIIKNGISKGNENTTRHNDIDKLTPAKVYTSNNHVNDKPFEGSNRHDINETRTNQNQPRTNLDRKTKASNRVNDRNVECEENVTPPKRETANYYNNRSNRYDEPIATHNQLRSNDRLAQLSNSNIPDKSHCNISQNNVCFTSQDVRFKNNQKEFKSDDLRSKLKHMEKHKDSQFNRIDFSKNTEDKDFKVTHIPKKNEHIFDDLKFKHKNVGKVINDLIIEKEIAKKIEIVGSFDNTKVIPVLNKDEPIFGVLKFKSKYVEQVNQTEVKLDSSKDTEFKKEQDKEVETLNLVNNKFDLVLKKDGINDCSKASPNVDVEKLSDINKDRIYHDKLKHTCDNKDYAPIFGVLKFKKKFVDSVNSETSKTSSIQISSENVCPKDQRPLHEVEERKLPSNDQMVSQCDDQMKQFSSFLNRLTQDNFETVLVKINQLEIEDDKFDECVKLLYEKAVIQKEFTEIFARLAAHLTLIKVENKMSFGTILLQRCREDFQKHVNSMDDWSETVDAQASLENVNFIGELFKVKMISEDEVFGCIDKLFSKSQDEDSIECICELLSTAGNFLEGSESKLEECFSKVDNLVAKRCSSRIRLIVMDLINLRKASWSKI